MKLTRGVVSHALQVVSLTPGAPMRSLPTAFDRLGGFAEEAGRFSAGAVRCAHCGLKVDELVDQASPLAPCGFPDPSEAGGEALTWA